MKPSVQGSPLFASSTTGIHTRKRVGQSTSIGPIPHHPIDSDSDLVYDSDIDPEFVHDPDRSITNKRKKIFPLLYCSDSDSSNDNFK